MRKLKISPRGDTLDDHCLPHPGEQSNVCCDNLMTRELMTFCQDVDADTGDLRLLLCFRAAYVDTTKGNWVWHPLHPEQRFSRGWPCEGIVAVLLGILNIYGMGNSVFEVNNPFSISQSSVALHLKVSPSKWSCLHCGFAADSLQSRSPMLERTIRGQSRSTQVAFTYCF